MRFFILLVTIREFDWLALRPLRLRCRFSPLAAHTKVGVPDIAQSRETRVPPGLAAVRKNIWTSPSSLPHAQWPKSIMQGRRERSVPFCSLDGKCTCRLHFQTMLDLHSPVASGQIVA